MRIVNSSFLVAEIIPCAQNKYERLADRIARLSKSGSILGCTEPFRCELLVDCPGAVDRFLQQHRE